MVIMPITYAALALSITGGKVALAIIIVLALALLVGFPLFMNWQAREMERELRQPPRPQPYASQIGIYKVAALVPFYVVLASVFAVAIAWATNSLATRVGGSLPWPLAQWALTTTPGSVALDLIFTVLVAALLYPYPREQGERLIGIVDITDRPKVTSPIGRRSRSRGVRAQQWLGSGQPARTMSFALLAVAAAAVVGVMVTGVQLLQASMHVSGVLAAACATIRCGPSVYLMLFCLLDGTFAASMVRPLAEVCWGRRIESQCGIRLRYMSSLYQQPLNYIRLPGVTADTASASLARFTTSGRRTPSLRRLAGYLLRTSLYLAMFFVVGSLSVWLTAQWRP